jgi:F420-0:gamma-glutamyl ligase
MANIAVAIRSPDTLCRVIDDAISIFPVRGLPEIEPGSDLASMILEASEHSGRRVADGDVVIVTSKIVSKSEGATIELDDVEPSEFSVSWGLQWEKDPRLVGSVRCSSRKPTTVLSARTLALINHRVGHMGESWCFRKILMHPRVTFDRRSRRTVSMLPS